MRRVGLGTLLALLITQAAQAAVVYIPIPIPSNNGPAIPPPARVGNYDAIHNVAVISAIGQSVDVEYRPTLGRYRKQQIDIADWQIDRMVASMIGQYLSDRFAFKDVAYDAAAFARLPNGLRATTTSDAELRSLLAALPNEGLDAFIVVRPDLGDYAPGVIGLALLSDPDPIEWANYSIDVVDAHSLVSIARAYSRVQFRAGPNASYAGLKAGPNLKLKNDLAIDDRQRNELHSDMIHVVSISLLETLRALKMSTTLPPIGARALVPLASADDPFASVKTVAVFSAIGDHLELREPGLIMGQHSEKNVPIADWKLDEEIERQARTALGKRFTVKDTVVDRTKLGDARLLGPDRKLKPDFPGLNPTSDVDAYVLFVKLPLLLDPKILVDGLGIGVWHRTTIFNQTTAIYAYYAVVLLDAQTLQVKRAVLATLSPTNQIPRPYQEVDKAFWPPSPNDLTAERAAKVREAVMGLLSDSVPETLLRAQLTGMTIADTPLGDSQIPLR